MSHHVVLRNSKDSLNECRLQTDSCSFMFPRSLHFQIHEKAHTVHFKLLQTHSSTSRWNCFCLFPRNSPIICLLKPFLWSRKWATPTGVSGTKFRSIRYWMPFSGFLETDERERGRKGRSEEPMQICDYPTAPVQMCVKWGTGFGEAGEERATFLCGVDRKWLKGT